MTTYQTSAEKNSASEVKAKRPRGTGSVFQMKGSQNFWIAYHRPGSNGKSMLVRESSGSDKIKTAENLLKQRIGELANSTWIEPRDRRVTVDELYASFLDDYRNNGFRSLRDAVQRWQRPQEETMLGPYAPGRLKVFFAGIRAASVTTDMLNRFVSESRGQGIANATINRDLAALRRAFHLALRAGKIQKVPCFPHLKEPAPRRGFVEEADYLKLAAASKELWIRALLATAYAFGFRKGELQNLRVSQVDLAARTITLNAGETKSGDGRSVSMTQDVHTLLSACVSGKKPADYVFTRGSARVLDFRGAWSNLCAAAGRPGLLFHDLRRSAVRNMVRRGIPEVVAMRISGHKTRSVFDRYNIVSDRDLLEAARKIEAGARVYSEFVQSSEQKQETGYTN